MTVFVGCFSNFLLIQSGTSQSSRPSYLKKKNSGKQSSEKPEIIVTYFDRISYLQILRVRAQELRKEGKKRDAE